MARNELLVPVTLDEHGWRPVQRDIVGCNALLVSTNVDEPHWLCVACIDPICSAGLTPA